ncbi:MAG: RecX family transcriptional regulator [Ferruginibacter sp.]|nr:RecX family transcriptional regulator [Ferruginibacter sp.]
MEEAPKNIGVEAAGRKIRQYCAYQERCHREVRDKLYSFGLYTPEVETLLSALIEEQFLNEERFAIAFAGGKFRMRQWGKLKIARELKTKGVSAYCIKKALRTLDESAYLATLQMLAEKKWATLSGHKAIRQQKVVRYLLQKGYEYERMVPVLKNLTENT